MVLDLSQVKGQVCWNLENLPEAKFHKDVCRKQVG